ncbi:hypothetical protein [Nocardioides zhouii]|uniref:Uncharacterized protein n=1 Tax=Nocardioides zhouii TaxID=1168729 RepID=A0A4Q2T2A3_9ACTN|nr:hypothetical protein [Nocardioides zhouii]RYC10888.1 hypothetical protein EUA94_11845 [Nocardioides zhouii]
MLDIGLFELLVFSVPILVTLTVAYWVIRLAVRHGTLDAYRIDRVDQRIAGMQAATRRTQKTYGGSEPE